MNDIFGDKGGIDGLNELFKQLKIDDKVLIAQLNDQRLSKLAEYDVTKGYMNIKVTPQQLQARFFELKHLVKTGETTLQGLEDDVYSRWGVAEEARESALQKAMSEDDNKPIIGFAIEDMKVAKMKENDKRNH